jgi:hypothetical protein
MKNKIAIVAKSIVINPDRIKRGLAIVSAIGDNAKKIMKQLITILIISIPILVQGQINLTSVEKKDLSKEISYKGEFLSCTNWKDSLGLNYLILSQSKIIKPPAAIEASKKYDLINYNGRIDTSYNIEAGYREKEIYAYHYIQTKDSTYVLWKLLDYVKECPFDLTIEFLTPKPSITDLDKNGICETWIVYWLGCRSDVSALNMKLIMHEGINKYAIRGTRKVRYGEEPGQVDGGKITKDITFNKLSKIINDYAIDLWAKYNDEN